MNRVRIFISSPGDVAGERQRALQVVESLQQIFDGTLKLEPLLWEQEPLLATADFQSQIRSPADFDIFATIIGSRLGSPLGPQFTRRDGTLYASGTEFEFEMAVAGYHANGKPDMLFYRKMVTPDGSSSEQLEKVSSFFDKWFSSPDGLGRIGSYHEFKHTDEFENLFAAHLEEVLRRFLPRPNNLPAPISSFLGRVDLIHQLSDLVLRDDVRLVTLTGATGAGKSRLALRTSRGLLPEFADGVFLVRLQPGAHAESLPATIADAIELPLTGDSPPMEQVKAALTDRELLLLLDGLEQAEAAAPLLADLLEASAGLKILTSRNEPLGINGEHTLAVPPLTLPENDASSLQDIQDSEAVQLFQERARAVRDDFELNADNAATVAEICRQLGGLPLSIERAASRLRSMSVTKLLRSLASIKVKDETGKTVYLISR